MRRHRHTTRRASSEEAYDNRPTGDGLLLLRRALLSAPSIGSAEGAQLQQRNVVSSSRGVFLSLYIYIYLCLPLSTALSVRLVSCVASAVLSVYLRDDALHIVSPSRLCHECCDFLRLNFDATATEKGTIFTPIIHNRFLYVLRFHAYVIFRTRQLFTFDIWHPS